MRALPRLCALRPNAQIVIAGGDERGYGASPPPGRSWRQTLCEEVPVHPARVHFVGVIDYAAPISTCCGSLRRMSYLTVPFVLSWSMLEAMSAGCLLIASRTPPVEEVIRSGDNGLLVDFFAPNKLAETVASALAARGGLRHLRIAARQTILQDYAVQVCLPRQQALVERLVEERSTPVARFAPRSMTTALADPPFCWRNRPSNAAFRRVCRIGACGYRKSADPAAPRRRPAALVRYSIGSAKRQAILPISPYGKNAFTVPMQTILEATLLKTSRRQVL